MINIYENIFSTSYYVEEGLWSSWYDVVHLGVPSDINRMGGLTPFTWRSEALKWQQRFSNANLYSNISSDDLSWFFHFSNVIFIIRNALLMLIFDFFLRMAFCSYVLKKNSFYILSYIVFHIQASLVIRGGYVPEKFMTREYQIYQFRPIYA